MAALAGVALVLSACGGGGGSSGASPPPASASGPAISRVIIAGDSLADAGAFGFRATVQNASNAAAGYPVYAEIVATRLGLAAPCPYFASSDRGSSFSTRPGCTNFAVAGSLVVNPVTRGGSGVPFSLSRQLETAVASNGGNWRAGDLVVVDAGANDAAALADAYLDALRGGAAEKAIYLALLSQQLEAGELTRALAAPDGDAVAAAAYMQALARTFWNTVRANTLDRGATRVALLTVPDITLTPRYRDIARDLATSDGAAVAADFQADLRRWIDGFNAELARLVAGEPRVALVPYAADFTAQLSTPAAFGLTNTTDAACPSSSDFSACTDAALDAAPPAGLAPGWWRSWYFSDRFHPSPRGHELLAQSVTQALATAGWR